MQVVDRWRALPHDEAQAKARNLGLEINVYDVNWDDVGQNLGKAYDLLDVLAGQPVGLVFRGENGLGAFKTKCAKEWDVLTQFLVRTSGNSFLAQARSEITLDSLRIRVALERFKLAKGAYPKDLAEVVPAYLDKLLLDPFSGKPYGYRLEADGHFVFWSVGEDLKDDGGKGNPKRFWDGPDYVFTSRPEKPAEARKEVP
jgi:hypothetical protein